MRRAFGIEPIEATAGKKAENKGPNGALLAKINEVAGEVQLKVKNAIEEMTNLNSEAVNVHVQGIKIAKEEITDEPEIPEPPVEISDDAEAETAKSEE